MPQQLIQKCGAKVWEGEFKAFREFTTESGAWENRLRFPGQYFDDETGNFYNYYRDYNPTTGRYFQTDPIGLIGGLNTYVYANGNPIGLIDRFGLSFTCICHVECASLPVTALVRCTRVETCIDNECGDVTTTSKEAEWYVWADRPFVVVGSFDCANFPGPVPGYPAPWEPPMS